MAELPQTFADRLAALEREHAAQRAELLALRRRLARRRGTALARTLAAALVVALLATPLAALAANFTDLNNGSPHNANINAIADAGISLGCNPAGTQYCPNQLVTREQMASFLARTAGLGTNPPIANAATAQTAVNATNAAQLGGFPAAQYLRASGGLVYSYSPFGYFTFDPTVTLVTTGVGFTRVSTTNAGDRSVRLPLDAPRSIFGVPLKVSQVEICTGSQVGTTAFINATTLLITEAAAVTVIQTLNDNQGQGICYTITPTTPVPLTGALGLALVVNFPDNFNTFVLGRVTVTLVP